jgi:hypothetical protein
LIGDVVLRFIGGGDGPIHHTCGQGIVGHARRGIDLLLRDLILVAFAAQPLDLAL